MKEYWLGTGIGYVVALLSVFAIYQDFDLCIYAGIILLGIILIFGKYLEERDIERLDKENEQ